MFCTKSIFSSYEKTKCYRSEERLCDHYLTESRLQKLQRSLGNAKSREGHVLRHMHKQTRQRSIRTACEHESLLTQSAPSQLAGRGHAARTAAHPPSPTSLTCAAWCRAPPRTMYIAARGSATADNPHGVGVGPPPSSTRIGDASLRRCAPRQRSDRRRRWRRRRRRRRQRQRRRRRRGRRVLRKVPWIRRRRRRLRRRRAGLACARRGAAARRRLSRSLPHTAPPRHTASQASD